MKFKVEIYIDGKPHDEYEFKTVNGARMFIKEIIAMSLRGPDREELTINLFDYELGQYIDVA